MKPLLLPLLLLALCVPAATQAQTGGPPFSRQIRGMELTQDPASGQPRLDALLRLSGSDDGLGPYDLSFELEVLVNGTQVAPPQGWSVLTDPAASTGIDCDVDCGSDCGAASVNGQAMAFQCGYDGVNPDGTLDCDCGLWLWADLGPVPAATGDEIMVLLRPAPGAVPDVDSDHKDWIIIYSGNAPAEPRKKHRPKEIVVVGSKVVAVVETDLDFLQGRAGLGYELELRVNGSKHGANIMVDELLWMPAAAGPSRSSGGAMPGQLHLEGQLISDPMLLVGRNPDGSPQESTGYRHVTAPGWDPVPLQPGDEIMVLLRPVPGAMPLPEVGDEVLVSIYDGHDKGWNRAMVDADNLEDLAYLQWAALISVGNSNEYQPMGFAVDLYDNGVLVDSHQQDADFLPFVEPADCFDENCHNETCAETYGINPDPGNIGNAWCELPPPGPTDLGCSCTATVTGSFFLPPGSPGPFDVVLRPLPGALPELPGFEEDDEGRFDPAATDAPDLALARPELHGNVPNPFNPVTTIAFTLPQNGDARLDVLDLRGQRVATLHRGLLPAGTHELRWDGTDHRGRAVGSGSYFSQLRVDGEVVGARKMVLSK